MEEEEGGGKRGVRARGRGDIGGEASGEGL